MNRFGRMVIVAPIFLPSVPAAQAAEKVLYSFCRQENCADGARPLASLIGMIHDLP